MAPRNRARGAVPEDSATAATGRSPKSANKYATPHTTTPANIIVNPTGAIASASTTPDGGVDAGGPGAHRDGWVRGVRPGNRHVRAPPRSVGSPPAGNHRTGRETEARTPPGPTIGARPT